MLSYFKTRRFPIHLLVIWWVGWILLSCTSLNEFIHPSWQTIFQLSLLVVMFYLGYLTVEWRWSHSKSNGFARRRTLVLDHAHMHRLFFLAAITCMLALLIALIRSGAFSTEFFEYYLKVRKNEATLGSLTGIHLLDVLTKILIFPSSYVILVVILASEIRAHKSVLFLCIVNFLSYSYLWQVNYPLVHLFWILVFFGIMQIYQTKLINFRVFGILVILFIALLASSANRFGGDIIGGLQRYIIGYHLIGFSFYDYQLHDPNSILHIHTFGRSSLGFLDQMLEGFLKMMGSAYQAASFENAAFNNDAIDVGLKEVKEFNAFGTLLFGFYRDFNIMGIIGGGYAYGAIITNSLYRSSKEWVHGAIFMILASSWMMGMMVNPIEQAYFWFSFVALGGIIILNKLILRRFRH